MRLHVCPSFPTVAFNRWTRLHATRCFKSVKSKACVPAPENSPQNRYQPQTGFWKCFFSRNLPIHDQFSVSFTPNSKACLVLRWKPTRQHIPMANTSRGIRSATSLANSETKRAERVRWRNQRALLLTERFCSSGTRSVFTCARRTPCNRRIPRTGSASCSPSWMRFPPDVRRPRRNRLGSHLSPRRSNS